MKNLNVKLEIGQHQYDALSSEKYNIFMGCGLGSGKTHTGSHWSLKKISQSHPKTLGIIAANSYPQLIDSTLRNVFKVWESIGVNYFPKDLPRSYHPFSLYVESGGKYREILCRSLDTYKKWSGMEVGWAWLDETWDTPKEAIDVVDARLRDDRSHIQMLMTTTLDDPSTWMYDMFVENLDETLVDVIYASTYANQRNLPDGYIDKLKSRYSEQMIKRMIMAQWVTLGGLQIYHAFNRNDNVSSDIAEYDENLPILWSHDFNIGEGKPMSSCICQIKKADGERIVTIFDEIILVTADTNQAVAEFEARNWYSNQKHRVKVYGDATGKSKDTRSKKTDYGIIRNAGFTNQFVKSVNPPIRTRHNVVNSMLKDGHGRVKLFVHPRCKTTIKGLETTKLKKGANYVEEETYNQHVTTALGYMMCVEFPLQGTNQLVETGVNI